VAGEVLEGIGDEDRTVRKFLSLKSLRLGVIMSAFPRLGGDADRYNWLYGKQQKGVGYGDSRRRARSAFA
jgi:hypothetical protein